MRFSTLIPIVSSISLGLAHNGAGLGSHSWNTTTSGFISTTDSSSIEQTATIRIELGNLSGFGVISLSMVGPASEPVELDGTPTSDPNSVPDQVGTGCVSCLNASATNPTVVPLYQNSSTLNFNTTTGYRVPLAPSPTISPAIFTGSGVQSRTLPAPAFLSAMLAWLL